MAGKPIEAKLRITGDSAGAVAAAKQVEQATEKVGTAAERAAAKQEKAAARAAAAAERQAEVERRAAERTARAAAKRDTDALAAELRQRQNQMRQLAPQLTDIFTGLASGQSPFMVAIQQGGQLRDIMGGTGNAVRALGSVFTATRVLALAFGGALATVAFQAVQGALESDRLRKSLALTGNTIGTTLGQLDEVAQRVAREQNASIGGVRDTVEAVVATGRFLGPTLESAVRATTVVSKLSGQAADETIKQFASLTDGVTAGAIKLNQSYNFLTARQVEYIRSLEAQGRSQEAIRFTLDELSQTIEQRSVPAIGLLERGWNGVKSVLSGVLDTLKAIGRDETAEERIAKLEKRLKTLQFGQRRFGDTPLRSQEIADVQAQLDAELALRGRDQVRAAERAIALQQEQEKIKQQSKSFQDSLAAIDLAGAQKILAQRLAALDQQQIATQQAYALGLRTAEQNALELNRIEQDRLAAQAAFVRRQIELAGASVASTPEEVNARNARVTALQAQLLEVNSKLRQAAAQAQGIVESAALERAQRNAQEWAAIWQRAQNKIRELAQQVEAARGRQLASPFARAEAESRAASAAIRQELADLERDLTLKISLTVDPGQKAELERQLAELRRVAGTVVTQRGQEARFGSLGASASTEQQRLAVREADIQQQVQAGQLTTAEGEQRILALRRQQLPVLQQIAEAMRATASTPEQRLAVEQLEQQIKALGTLQGEIEATARSSAVNSLAGALSDIVTGAKSGKEALLDMVSSFTRAMLDVINRRLAEALIDQFAKAFSSTGSSGSGGFWSSLARVFTTTYHTGGVVGDGRPATRAVNPALFALAPRFHSGLMPDEFPAILQRGETVRTARQERQLRESMSVGGLSITNNVQVSGAQADDEGAREAIDRLAQRQREAFTAWAVTEMRPGGLLSGLRSRG